MHYVAGLLFEDNLGRVALVKKNKPRWQAGLLNGIGGKVEDGETSLQAMIREFKEETGATIEGWELFCQLIGDGWHVDFYRAFSIVSIKQVEEEYVGWYNIIDVLNNLPTISNIKWLIPLALDRDNNSGKLLAKVEYSEDILKWSTNIPNICGYYYAIPKYADTCLDSSPEVVYVYFNGKYSVIRPGIEKYSKLEDFSHWSKKLPMCAKLP